MTTDTRPAAPAFDASLCLSLKAHVPYHITVFDLFNRGEPDDVWAGGTFDTAEQAIASVKSAIDRELAHFWTEACRDGETIPTLERLVSQYESFAEMPIAFDADGKAIFDSRAYVNEKATEMMNVARAKAQP